MRHVIFAEVQTVAWQNCRQRQAAQSGQPKLSQLCSTVKRSLLTRMTGKRIAASHEEEITPKQDFDPLFKDCDEHQAANLFFPRVRTPCGHGAQVIVEGREEQTDGGERNEGPKTNPKPNTQARRPKLHHLVVFPLH